MSDDDGDGGGTGGSSETVYVPAVRCLRLM